MRSVTAHNILAPSHAALVTNSGLTNLKMTRVSGMPGWVSSSLQVRTLAFSDSSDDYEDSDDSQDRGERLICDGSRRVTARSLSPSLARSEYRADTAQRDSTHRANIFNEEISNLICINKCWCPCVYKLLYFVCLLLKSPSQTFVMLGAYTSEV